MSEPETSAWYRKGELRGTLIDSNVERLSPALKNIHNYLFDRGRLPHTLQGEEIDRREGQKDQVINSSCSPLWVEVESDYPETFWRSRQEVDVVIDRLEFDQFAQSIRGKAGQAYFGACDQYAESVLVRADVERVIRYVRPNNRPETTAGACVHGRGTII